SRVIILFSTMHPHRSILCPYTTLFRSISTVQKIEEDTYLFHEGDRADEIYIIKSGLIEISKLAANGKEMLLRICKNSDLIGELTLFSEQPAYILSARVIHDGDVLVINLDTIVSSYVMI